MEVPLLIGGYLLVAIVFGYWMARGAEDAGFVVWGMLWPILMPFGAVVVAASWLGEKAVNDARRAKERKERP